MTENNNTPARYGAWLLQAANLVAYALLLNIAVASWLAGSTYRIWIAVAVLLYVAVSVFIFVKFRRVWSSARPGTRFALSLFLIAAIISLPWAFSTTNSYDTFITGVSGQAVPAVLLFLSLLVAVVYALTWNRIPTAGRAFVAVLALYALSSLGVAIYTNADFVALFHGSSFASFAPRWLQGAVIGAVFVLPVCLAISMGRMFLSPSAMGLAAKLLLVAFCLLSLVPPLTAKFGHNTNSALVVESDTATTTAAPAQEPLNAAGRALATKEFAGRLATLSAYVDQWRDTSDLDLLDFAAVVRRVGTDPNDLMNFVRYETSPISYAGSLKGSKGALADRSGNSLDRTLLLQALLGEAGVRSRLARAEFQADEINLISPPATSLPIIESQANAPEIDEQQLYRELGIDGDTLQSLDVQERESAAALENAIRRTARLSEALAEKAFDGAEQMPEDAAQGTQDHWWIQARVDSDWVDLDVSGVVAEPGDRPADVKHYNGDIPANEFHTVTVSVGISYESSGRIKETKLVDATFRSSDVGATTIRVMNVPEMSSELPGSSSDVDVDAVWVPVVAIDNRLLVDKSFTMNGKIRQANQVLVPGGHSDKVESAGGLLDSLPGGEEIDTTAKSDAFTLRSHWISYEIASPGAGSREYKRIIFDTGDAPSDNALGVYLALSTVTDVYIQSADISDVYAETLGLLSLEQTIGDMTSLAEAASDAQVASTSEEILSQPPVAGDLITLASMRNLRSNPVAAMYLRQPNILSSHSGARIDRQGVVSAFKAYDIVANQAAPLVASSARQAKIYQGIWDTYAEAALASSFARSVGGRAIPNAFASYSETMVSSAELTLDNTTNTWSLQSSLSDQSWQISPDGTTLGFGTTGWGEASAEYAMLVQFAESWAACVGSSFVHVLAAGSVQMGNATLSMGSPNVDASKLKNDALICAAMSLVALPFAMEKAVGNALFAKKAAIAAIKMFFKALGNDSSESGGAPSGSDGARSTDPEPAPDPDPEPPAPAPDNTGCTGPCWNYETDAPPDLDWYYNPGQ